MLDRFPHYYQLDFMDCGPACLRMVAKHYGKSYSLQYLREHSYISREGVSLRGIIEAAEHIGLRTLPVKLPFDGKSQGQSFFVDAPLPSIVHWRQQHFVVVYKISRRYIWIADPNSGKFKLDHETFRKYWQGDGEQGIALLLEPTPEFYKKGGQREPRANYLFLTTYLKPYRRYFIQLMIGLFLGSVFQLIFPFLTQAIVDIGIQNQNIGFIYLILIAQLMLFLGQTSVTVIQNWLLLHIGTRINVSLISDFLAKLMKLPIGYFDAKMVGDLLQRIADQDRIEAFLTSSALNFIFSAFNLLVFGMVLLIYDFRIFLIFLIASILYVLWIFVFLRRRKEIDYHRFQELSYHQNTLIELIQGMQEIKLQNSGRKRRWQWSDIQARLFGINLQSLAIDQYQNAGGSFITQLKDILITFLTAKLVIDGEITLGMMLAVQFIIGQLNVPLRQMITFIRTGQDAKISLERLWEIQNLKAEEEDTPFSATSFPSEQRDIRVEGLSFQYNKLADLVLKDISLHIPEGKVTAIVGASGSGKTTLVKLLLGFYPPGQGSIKACGLPLSNINKAFWRSQCGAVMQDGYIFSDTIANNIAESAEQVDKQRLVQAVETANIRAYIESLPLSYNTMIGAKGNGISQGQRQRILIARAVYKDPEFLFFDEATNALDARNEKTIVHNLEQFFRGKTVVVVAHRLSTVKNADQIVVLENGEVVEKGAHQELIEKKGAYYELIRDQLELGA
ncbi:MAG: peptidase domain-containing ABC transporter [Lewinellaceae bacterium]|nr:peptidase domain-containing ABC transporter [Phaeodactylibacter sp.]MCB0614799.1 peptidase domain-containing ABC transporter [Phaeodactylibacter sp.]MCB9350228.1 peptidase domain-containing ABC transporter [Lewinellaceae bacterium]